MTTDMSGNNVSRSSRRVLQWDGCFNVRDLGDLSLGGGRRTKLGRLVRADSLTNLTADGWGQLRRFGIRRIVDLRDPSERLVSPLRASQHCAGIEIVEVPVFSFDDKEFWDRWHDLHHTAPFYEAALRRWPNAFAAAVRAITNAPAGSVVFHCRVGRDRAGLVSGLLLRAVGVDPEEIARDFALSAPNLEPLYARLIVSAKDEGERRRLERENIADEQAMLELMAKLDVREYFRLSGLEDIEIDRIATRLVT